MDHYKDLLDRAHCLRKEMEYYAKAADTTDENLKSAYEAAAREYRYRGSLLKRSPHEAA